MFPMAPPARPLQPPYVGDGEDQQQNMVVEGTGESSSPPRSPHAFNPGLHEVQRRIMERLRQTGRHDCTLADPTFHTGFARHLERLPWRYLLDLDLEDKVDDVLLHWRILEECADPNKRPVFYARLLKCKTVRMEDDDGIGHSQGHEGPCQKLFEELSLERRKTGDRNDSISISSKPRPNSRTFLLHEIIFSSIDRPKLLSRLTTLLSEVGLNIQEAHVYSTVDGFCLDIFIVDGWDTEETDDLITAIKETLTQEKYIAM